MTKKVRVHSFKSLPARLPVKDTIIALLVMEALGRNISRDLYLIASTILWILLLLLWIAAIYYKLNVEEPVDVLNEE